MKLTELIYCEFLKLKRSKICFIAFLGTLVTPLLVFMMTIRSLLSGFEISLFDFYDSGFVFLMPLFAPLIFSVVTAYLFSREYTEKTLKTIFLVPLSKVKFLISKFIVLFLCNQILMILTWIELLVLAIICNFAFEVQQLTVMSAIYFLVKMVYGSILIYAVITPIAYLAIRSRGFFAPVLIASVIALSDVVLTGSPIAAYYPWTSTYLLVTGRISSFGGSYLISYIIIGLLCFSSICGSIIHFRKIDIL